MAGVRITCPKCGRILGDTDKSIDAVLNCNGCKNRVRVQMTVVRFEDYFENDATVRAIQSGYENVNHQGETHNAGQDSNRTAI